MLNYVIIHKFSFNSLYINQSVFIGSLYYIVICRFNIDVCENIKSYYIKRICQLSASDLVYF